MIRFLSIVRSIFGWGTVFYLLGNCLLNIDFLSFNTIIQIFYSFFFTLSPIRFFVLTLISTAYLRKTGQIDAIHQDQFRVTSFFKCLAHDLAAPFKITGGFIEALADKDALERKKLIARFVGMMAILVFCGFGMLFFL